MPTTAGRRPKADQVYVALEAVSLSLDGMPVTVRAGERRRGDDPVVRAHFNLFGPDGTRVPAVPQFELPRDREREPDRDLVSYEGVKTVDVLISRRPLRVWEPGAKRLTQLPVGTAVARDSELVRMLPDAFETPKVMTRLEEGTILPIGAIAAGARRTKRRTSAGELMATVARPVTLRIDGRTERLIPGVSRFAPSHPVVQEQPHLFRACDARDSVTSSELRALAARARSRGPALRTASRQPAWSLHVSRTPARLPSRRQTRPPWEL